MRTSCSLTSTCSLFLNLAFRHQHHLMDHLHHSMNGHQSCAPSSTSMGSSTSHKWMWPSGRTLPSNYIIFVLDLKLEQQHKMPLHQQGSHQRLARRTSRWPSHSWWRNHQSGHRCSWSWQHRSSNSLWRGARQGQKEHQTILLTSWRIQPRQHQSQIITFVDFVKVKTVLNLGDFSSSLQWGTSSWHLLIDAEHPCTSLDRTTSTSSIQNMDGRHIPLWKRVRHGHRRPSQNCNSDESSSWIHPWASPHQLKASHSLGGHQVAHRQLLLQQLHPAGIKAWHQQHGATGRAQESPRHQHHPSQKEKGRAGNNNKGYQQSLAKVKVKATTRQQTEQQQLQQQLDLPVAEWNNNSYNNNKGKSRGKRDKGKGSSKGRVYCGICQRYGHSTSQCYYNTNNVQASTTSTTSAVWPQ